MKIPEFNPTAGIPKTSYGPKSGGPTFDNATWFSTVRPSMNESRPSIADSDVNCYQEMDENNPIYQAIDLGGGQVCDISGVLRELDKAGFVIVPKEPTNKMIAAALDDHNERRGKQSYTDAYRAMIRAVE